MKRKTTTRHREAGNLVELPLLLVVLGAVVGGILTWHRILLEAGASPDVRTQGGHHPSLKVRKIMIELAAVAACGSVTAQL